VAFAERRYAAAVDALDEAERLYLTLAVNEEVSAETISELLGLNHEGFANLERRTIANLGDSVPVPDPEVRALQERIIRGLAQQAILAEVDLNDKRQVLRARDAVVSTVPEGDLEQALADVRLGSGGELTEPKSGGQPDFHSVRSSCALAVSVFGPWRREPASLTVAGMTGFTKLRFEVKFPILDDASAFKTPPNLDVVAWRADAVVAIESKFVEHIAPTHTAQFNALYDEAILSSDPSWHDKTALLRVSPDEYRFFNAAQIIKHYLGLRSDRRALINGRPTTLLYLYWEPQDPAAHHFFAQHRAEVADFADGLTDRNISFVSLSYRELLEDWKGLPSPQLRRHVNELEARYLLSLSDLQR
jgi:hypothetical protein